MPEISFYTLKESGGTARMRQACLLTEEAYLAGERVLVWLEGAAELARFDDLLWSFGERSFVPHEALPADARASEAPVLLHSGAIPDAAPDALPTLVTLRSEPHAETLRFARVIEIIDADPDCRNAGRARFRWYREQGVNPQHIEVA